MSGRDFEEVEAEVIPPRGRRRESSGQWTGDDPLVRILASLLDTAFQLPGTRFRFGLDPIIGAIPGVGDGLSALLAVFLIVQSARYNVPKVVLARMALNVILNAVLGAVPVLGDAFSFWFKSNSMNYALLKKHAGADVQKRTSTVRDWVFVVGLVGGTLLILGLAMYGFFSLLFGLIRAATH